jgi:hypothetical protein
MLLMVNPRVCFTAFFVILVTEVDVIDYEQNVRCDLSNQHQFSREWRA